MKTTKRQVLIRKEDTRKRWLMWILDFIQADFDSLTRLQREKLVDDLLYFTWSGFPHIKPRSKDFDYHETHFFPPPESRFPEEQERYALAESNLGQIQEALRSMLQDIQIHSIGPQNTPKEYELCESMAVLSMSSVFIWDKDQFQLRFRPKDDNDLVAWAKVHFAELLQGLPVHAISKCKGCGTFYLNLTNREKFYCNSACASRSIQKEKRDKLREEDPDKYEAYLEKQSGYYWKEQKARLGNVKRPPRKKRWRQSE